MDRAEHASALLFGERITELSADEVMAVFDDVPSTEMAAALFANDGLAIADMLVATKVAASKGEAMRLVKGGGVEPSENKGSWISKAFKKVGLG